MFALSSRPTASRVIYLDFNGHVTNDPAWGPSPIVSSAFDLDGSPDTFSTAERAAIFEIWQRVTEDYAAVRRQRDDGRSGSRSPSPHGHDRCRLRPARGDQPDELVRPGSSCACRGRVAHSASHWWGCSTATPTPRRSCSPPAWRSGRSPRPCRTRPVTRSVSTTTRRRRRRYYNGHGVWAPIMGRGTDPSKPFTQWSKGEYAGANNLQDDLELIASLTGFRPDDHGGVPERATIVSSSSTTSGVIGSTGDRDVFAVDVGAGNLAVTLRPPPGTETWTNLLARLVVRDSAGTVVATQAPSDPVRRGRSPSTWRSLPAATPSRSNRSDGSTRRRASPPTARSAPIELSVAANPGSRCGAGGSFDVHADHAGQAHRHP